MFNEILTFDKNKMPLGATTIFITMSSLATKFFGRKILF